MSSKRYNKETKKNVPDLRSPLKHGAYTIAMIPAHATPFLHECNCRILPVRYKRFAKASHIRPTVRELTRCSLSMASKNLHSFSGDRFGMILIGVQSFMFKKST